MGEDFTPGGVTRITRGQSHECLPAAVLVTALEIDQTRHVQGTVGVAALRRDALENRARVFAALQSAPALPCSPPVL